MYLVSDNYGDFRELMNYKEVKDMLVDELVEDTIENYDDKDIVKSNVELLSKMCKNDTMDINYLIDNLQSYGWHVLNVFDIQKGINDIREYVGRKSDKLKIFDDILKYIDEELK